MNPGTSIRPSILTAILGLLLAGLAGFTTCPPVMAQEPGAPAEAPALVPATPPVLPVEPQGLKPSMDPGVSPSPEAEEALPASAAEQITAVSQARAREGVRAAAANTILTSIVAALITYTLAIVHAFGVLYFGAWTRRILNFSLSTLACVSPIVLLLVISAAWNDMGLLLVVFLAISIYPLIARQLLTRVFDAAPNFHFMQATILGHGPLGVFLFYGWPRFLPLTLPFFFLGFIYSLLIESMFSSLGLVTLPNGNTWGSLIHLGLDQLLDNPWIIFYSGIAIMISTLIASACIPILDRLLSVPAELT